VVTDPVRAEGAAHAGMFWFLDLVDLIFQKSGTRPTLEQVRLEWLLSAMLQSIAQRLVGTGFFKAQGNATMTAQEAPLLRCALAVGR
jgi:hypothetical protein